MIAQFRLTERYRPSTLSEVIGQPSTGVLAAFARRPFARCWLFTGPPGTGKSAAASALANDVGAVDDLSGYDWTTGAALTKENVERRLRQLWTRPFNGPWNVLVIEELERLSNEARGLLQTGLESAHLPPCAIVVATSNDTSGVGPALLERFGAPLEFPGGPQLCAAGRIQVAKVWRSETDAPLPGGWDRWGWQYRDGRPVRFSLRMALEACEQALLMAESAVAA